MSEGALVGVVLVGHGESASALLSAARGVLGADALPAVRPVDAGSGRDEGFDARVRSEISKVDGGRGVLLIVDLFGSSPCQGCLDQGGPSCPVVLSGLNLAMLLKLAHLDRAELSPQDLGEACAHSGAKAVTLAPAASREESPS